MEDNAPKSAKNMRQYEAIVEASALFQVGFIKVVDGVMALSAATCVCMSFYNKAFGCGDVAIPLMIALILLCLEIIILVYRSMYFSIRCIAMIDSIPENAAKMAVRMSSDAASQATPGQKH